MNEVIEDHHRQGLGLGPGSPLVPRLRRLCGPESRAADDARPRHRARKDGVRQRHRLLEPLSLLHGELRLPHHPRPRARSRPGSSSPIPSSTCGSSPATATRCRSAATTRCTCCAATSTARFAAVQQRDLRADQGPIFADQPHRHALALDPVRIGRPARQPVRLRARLRRAVRRPRDRRPQEPARRAEGRPRPQGRQLRRDLPELHGL